MSDLLKVFLVVGARPNFMKMAPLYSELTKKKGVKTSIVHTGQHYDYEMSQAFFEELDLPKPNYFLGAGSGTHAEQTSKIMIQFEKTLLKEKPDLVVVFGDVNSTLACSVVARKLFIPVAHVEAGLRSFDMTMPEEINRKVTDAISDLLFTPSKDADENLKREGISRNKIHFVGNIMIDSLITILEKIDKSYEDKILQKCNLQMGDYVLVTLHRPFNVDSKGSLEEILNFLNNLSQEVPVIFPMHPRTRSNIDKFGMKLVFNKKFYVSKPLKYTEFIVLEKNARFVLTDSGGIQEETTYFNLPCLTLRPNTERPITVTEGTNELVNMENIKEKSGLVLSGNWKEGKVPQLWDGKTGQRIARMITEHNNGGYG
jgi:UDP-N-acetylglucosamine 2-epimerase (non-hydrolysing)